MTLKSKILSLVATLWALPAGLLHAQQAFGTAHAVKFTTSFPFYVSSQKMPAGSYVMIQPNIYSDLVLIRDTDSSHSALILYTPTLRTQPIAHGEVTFRQYGDTDYLSDVTLTGEETGLTVPESPAEKRTARANHEMASLRAVALQSNIRG
jgi:hypothetical protein